MDKRLSGVLAWGALIVILGIPGADVVGRRMAATDSQANVAAAPEAQSTSETATAAAAADASSERPAETVQSDAVEAPPPADSVASAEPPNLRGSIATVGAMSTTPTPRLPVVEPTPEAPVVEAPAAELASTFSDVTVLSSATQAVVDVPTVAQSPSAVEAASGGGSAIAARVREVLLSGGSSGSSGAVTVLPNASVVSGPETEAPMAQIAAISADPSLATATFAQVEAVPYPTSAEARPRAPVVIAASQPQEPIVEIRRDNAVFFRNWTFVPPLPIGSGPGN